MVNIFIAIKYLKINTYNYLKWDILKISILKVDLREEM